MVNWMLVAIKCIGVGWILLTFFIVLHSYISLVNGGNATWTICQRPFLTHSPVRDSGWMTVR
ncbi:hypothetical protein A8A19_05820 [Salmonella enterica]|nr:hypothetical protein [Salmonella enterica]